MSAVDAESESSRSCSHVIGPRDKSIFSYLGHWGPIYTAPDTLTRNVLLIEGEEKGITGARGVAALYVFASHLVVFHQFFYQNALLFSPVSAGFSGVDFFFVLSGYLLTKKTIRGDYNNGGSFAYAKYIFRRILRIWPAYWVALAFILIAGFQPVTFLTFFFLENYFRSSFSNTPIWSLAIEELYYFVLPVWILLFKRLGWKTMLYVFFITTLAYRVYGLGGPGGDYWDKQIPAYVFAYALGTVAGMGKKPSLGPRYSAVLSVAILLVSAFIIQGNSYSPLESILFPIAYYVMITNVANSRFFTNPVSMHFGRISYSFYLFHYFILALLYGILGLNGAPLEASSFAIWALASFLLAFCAAEVIYRAVESPFIRMGKKLIRFDRQGLKVA